MTLGPHQVTRLRGTPVEGDYGNQATDWSDPDRLLIVGCSVQPQPNIEFTDAREALEDRNVVWAPGLPDLTARDRIEYAGQTYDIVGHPKRWDFNPAHTEITIRRSTG